MKYGKDPPVGTSLLRSVRLKFASHATSKGESLMTSLFTFSSLAHEVAVYTN